MNKLFIGGLSWGIDSNSLKDHFSVYGEITESKVITDRESGRSRGFGFITFERPDSAERAIQEMDGKELDGRSVKVNMATDKPRPTNRW